MPQNIGETKQPVKVDDWADEIYAISRMIYEESQEEVIIVFHLRTTKMPKIGNLLHPDLPLCPSWQFRMNEKAMLGKWKDNMSSAHLLNI